MKLTMRMETVQVTRAKGLCALARKCGVSRGHLSRVLHGERRPSARLAGKIERYTGEKIWLGGAK